MSERPVTLYESGQAFHLEHWPRALHALSMPGIQLSLSPAEHQALLTVYMLRDDPESRDDDQIRDTAAPLGMLRQRLDDAIAMLGGVAFVKLGSRSPKDSWWAMTHGFACYRGAGALHLLFDSTERIADDLGAAKNAGITPSIWVRQWAQIPRWTEFRCLVKQRRLIGVSQYDYLAGELPEIIDNAAQLAQRTAAFVASTICALHVDDAVVDVAFRDGNLDAPLLIEINPFCAHTDPCLFEGDNPLMGAPIAGPTFRYIGDGRHHGRAKRPTPQSNARYLAPSAVEC